MDKKIGKASAQGKETAKILVVEDDHDFSWVVRHWLEPEYQVLSSTDGEELLDELEALRPELLILDINLPGTDGFDLCRSVRNNPDFTALPILFLTGAKEDSEFLRYLQVGGSAYLTKPVERPQLLSTVRELIGNSI